MRPRTLGLLFLVVAGLLAFIWFYERELPSSDERLELADRVLRLEADDLRGLTLGRGESSVRLERVATGDGENEEAIWWLREPLEARADGSAVDGLVDQLIGLDRVRTLEAIDAEELGLAQPRGLVTLETVDGSVELMIGSGVPASSTMVVAVSGRDDAYVVADGLWSELEKAAGDWRSRDLGPGSREAIQRIALGAGANGVTLGRRGESFWVEAPFVDKADRDLVSALLGEIISLRVESFVDEPPEAEPELAAGEIEVVVDDRERALKIEIGGPAGAEGDLRLARIDGQLVEIRTELASSLARTAEQWRSRSWASLEVFQIDRVEARDADGETVFERDGGEWLRDGGRVEYEPVSDLLYALTGVEALSASDEEVEPGAPVLTLELVGNEDDRRETLSLYAADGSGASRARVAGREVTLLLAEGAVADLQLKLAEARSATEPSADDEDLEPLTEDS